MYVMYVIYLSISVSMYVCHVRTIRYIQLLRLRGGEPAGEVPPLWRQKGSLGCKSAACSQGQRVKGSKGQRVKGGGRAICTVLCAYTHIPYPPLRVVSLFSISISISLSLSLCLSLPRTGSPLLAVILPIYLLTYILTLYNPEKLCRFFLTAHMHTRTYIHTYIHSTYMLGYVQ